MARVFNTQLREQLVLWAEKNMTTREVQKMAAKHSQPRMRPVVMAEVYVGEVRWKRPDKSAALVKRSAKAKPKFVHPKSWCFTSNGAMFMTVPAHELAGAL